MAICAEYFCARVVVPWSLIILCMCTVGRMLAHSSLMKSIRIDRFWMLSIEGPCLEVVKMSSNLGLYRGMFCRQPIPPRQSLGCISIPCVFGNFWMFPSWFRIFSDVSGCVRKLRHIFVFFECVWTVPTFLRIIPDVSDRSWSSVKFFEGGVTLELDSHSQILRSLPCKMCLFRSTAEYYCKCVLAQPFKPCNERCRALKHSMLHDALPFPSTCRHDSGWPHFLPLGITQHSPCCSWQFWQLKLFCKDKYQFCFQQCFIRSCCLGWCCKSRTGCAFEIIVKMRWTPHLFSAYADKSGLRYITALMRMQAIGLPLHVLSHAPLIRARTWCHFVYLKEYMYHHVIIGTLPFNLLQMLDYVVGSSKINTSLLFLGLCASLPVCPCSALAIVRWTCGAALRAFG